MKIKKGDNVKVIAGKDRGKTGKVVRALPALLQVIVEGVNVKKKHQRPTRRGQKGQIIDVTMPVHVSNVQILDPKADKPTRVGYKIEQNKKTRIAQKSGSALD